MAKIMIYNYDDKGIFVSTGEPDYGLYNEVLMPANSTKTHPKGETSTWSNQRYNENAKAWEKVYLFDGQLSHKLRQAEPIEVYEYSMSEEGLTDKLNAKYPDFTRSTVDSSSNLADFMDYQESTDTFEPDYKLIMAGARSKIKEGEYELLQEGLVITGHGKLKGKRMDCTEDSVSRLHSGLNLVELTGGTELVVRDYHNNNHTVPVAEVRTAIGQLGKHVQNRLIIQWENLDSLEGKTIEELGSILVG